MAKTLWGQVFFHDRLAGVLREEPGRRFVFTYEDSFLTAREAAPIAYTLPLRREPHVSHGGLHAFFDNLVAEGWLRRAQARALRVGEDERFALLLGFGCDLAGAVSIVDPAPAGGLIVPVDDRAVSAALANRASLSGIQRKLLVVRSGRGFRPAQEREVSTHIAKLATGSLREIVEIEYLATLAARSLLPGDPIVKAEIGSVEGLSEPALLVERFDRTAGGRKLHFEEFNQLFGKGGGDDKYDGAYEDMGAFIQRAPECLPAEADRLYRRILACLLLGNTDAHLKNFAMFHTRDGLRLTPSYDIVAASLFPEYQTIALSIGQAGELGLGQLKPKHLAAMGAGFGLSAEAMIAAIDAVGARLPAAEEAIAGSEVGDAEIRNRLIQGMKRRWRASFASTGQLLSKRRSKGGSTKA